MSYAASDIQAILDELTQQSMEILSSAINDGVAKGFISVRQSDPMLIKKIDSDAVEFRHSVVLDYLGSEKVEALEKEIADLQKANEYLQKINGDLHQALSDFYQQTKANKWLKNQSNT